MFACRRACQSGGFATDQNSIDALASRPLSSVEDGGIVIEKGREDLGKEPINGDLPFDLRPHNAAGSVVAKSMLTRMEKDIRWWADTANGAKTQAASLYQCAEPSNQN